jgi:hypothetical protein
MKYKPDERNIGYCQGFVDGYNDGIRDNPYDGGSFDIDEQYRHIQYKLGYDAGVAVYCQEKLDDPEYEE